MAWGADYDKFLAVRALWRGFLTSFSLLTCVGVLQAGGLVVIGDSLSAEYEAIPDVPGLEDPTAYAAVTVGGWESMSWVEVLGRLRSEYLDLGEYRPDLLGWRDLRFSGYEFNFASPGFTAAQYEDIVTSSLTSNPQYLTYRSTLEQVLRQRADKVVVWLGANEFRGNYGYLYDGGDATDFLNELENNLAAVVDFVVRQKPGLQVVIGTIPDLGAAPDKYTDHPDPEGQARVTAVAEEANRRIRMMAEARGIGVADVFSLTRRLMLGETLYYGAVHILPGLHDDNHPRYYFTRDGLHPNTASQIAIAYTFVEAFNETFGVSIPSLGDGEALALLGLDNDLPYWEWTVSEGLDGAGMESDSDGDGFVNVVEYACGTDPRVVDRPDVSTHGTETWVEARISLDPERLRHVEVRFEQSADLDSWDVVEVDDVAVGEDGDVVAGVQRMDGRVFIRISVVVRQPE